MKQQLLRGVVRGLLGNRRTTGWIGRKRRGGADHALDPQIAAILELERITRTPALDSMSPPAARRFAAEGLSPLDADPAAMAELHDFTVPGPAGAPAIPVRQYVPPHAHPHWIIYFHGGGGVIGSIAASDVAVRGLAARTRCTVASVEYRLGPEHKHPAAIEDAVAAYTALLARVPVGARVAVAGDSFGGFLAAHVDHAARERGVRPPDVQVLLYPIVDFTLVSPSIARFGHGYLLTHDLIHWFRRHYFHDADDRRAASPQYWPTLRGTAAAVVVTAGYDPLVEEGDAHAARLGADGVTVRHRQHPGLIHGFLSMTGAVTAAREAIDQMCDDTVALLTAK